MLEIDLWDVGQGDCSVIKLPSGGLLIIDVGPRGSPLIDWLNEGTRIGIAIEAIVLTHNDADHAGALPSIVATHKSRIKALWMLLDSPVDDERFQKIFRAAREGESAGFYKIRRLEDGQVLWSDEDRKIKLSVIYPGFTENIDASNPNQSSGVIVLEVYGKRLFGWPGDLELRTTAAVFAENPPWMLFGPHHGGPVDYPTKAVRKRLLKRSVTAAANLMAEIRAAAGKLSPARVFVSVGTKNPHHHPRPGYLRLLSSVRSRVTCSQLTFCCERKRVLERTHVLQGSGLLGLRAARTGVSCRGSMRLYVRNGGLVVDKFDAVHLARVTELLRPQCLRGQGWHTGEPLPAFRD
jgi:beta-lactamase superfamily II metal-dependent hydrolase